MHRGICDRNEGLHAAIQIARHHVGGTDIDDGLVGRQVIAVSKAENAAMFQKTPDNRLGANIVGKPRNARTQAADATHNEIDLHASLARHVECVNYLWIDQRIHLHPDRRRTSGLGMGDLVLNVFQNAGAQREG